MVGVVLLPSQFSVRISSGGELRPSRRHHGQCPFSPVLKFPSSCHNHWLLLFFDALLDSFFEVGVLHGRRHPLLVVDLLVHIRLGAVAPLSHQDVQLHCAGNQHSFQLCPEEQSEKLLQVQSSPDTQADQRCEVAMRHRGHKFYLRNELVARAVDRVDVDQRLQHNVQLLEVLRFLGVPDRPDVVVDVQSEIFSNRSNVLIPS